MNKQTEKNVLYGIFSMLLHSIAIAVLYGLIKDLRNHLSSNLIVFLFKFILLVGILPYTLKKRGTLLKTKKLALHILRGFLSVGGSLTLFHAIKYIDLVDATAVGYLEQVLWALIGMCLFKEAVKLPKILAALTSFLGAILVVYPEIITYNQGTISFGLSNANFKGFNYYYIFVLMSIIFWAGNCAVVKLLGTTESNEAQIFYVMLFTTLFASPLAFFEWQPYLNLSYLSIPTRMYSFDELGLSFSHIPYIIALGLCYFLHNVGFFQALKHADLSTVIPYEYSRLIFAGIIGFLFFNESPEFGSIIGYASILIAGIYLLKHEKRQSLEKKIIKLEIE